MDFLSIYFSAFILGLASNLHCLGMCGPLILAIPIPENRNKWIFTFEYLIGKAFSYFVLGIGAGFLGWGVHLMNYQQYLSIFSGILIIFMASFTVLTNRKMNSKLHQWVTIRFSDYFKSNNRIKYLAMGFLNGLLPCGMVYVAMVNALTASNPIEGGLAMFIFGLGTSPILVAVFQLRRIFKGRYKHILKKASLYITLLIGVVMILRGANLGIPYLSPELSEHKVSGCCS